MNDPIQNEGEILRAAAANTGQDNAGQEHASQDDIVISLGPIKALLSGSD